MGIFLSGALSRGQAVLHIFLDFSMWDVLHFVEVLLHSRMQGRL